MPWHVEPNHPDCPPDTPFAVVKDDDETVEGCHATEDDANAQIDALNLAEGEASLHGDVFATELDPVMAETYGEPTMGEHPLPIEAYSLGHWEGTLTVEGTPSGDGREFDRGALVWRDLPLTMYWQMQTAPEHDGSVAVSRVDELFRDGDAIKARGVFDMQGQHGAEAHRLVHGGFLRGQSVSLDDLKESDIEFIFPEPEEGADEEGDPMEMLFMQPERVIFHHGRIMDTLLTGQPAFQEAYITLIPDEQVAGQTTVPAGDDGENVSELPSAQHSSAVRPHSVAVVDGQWNTDRMAARLPLNMSPEFATLCFAWTDPHTIVGHEMPKQAGRFLHHDITQGGMPGPANLTAVSAAIGMLNGANGGTDIPDSDRRAVYEHLATHLRDAGRSVPPLVTVDEMNSLRALTASVSVIDPPQAWFVDPKFRGASPWTVEDSGEVHGHVALWKTCHISYTNQCVTPPRETEFAYFTTGEVLAKEGSRWPVGSITFGTNHAPGHLGARPAVEHYENTGFVAADVACGADKFGIWVHGALRPGINDNQKRAIRAAAVSGDWRRIGGRLRLVGGLLVNVPGFPIPRTRSYVHDGAQSALVASGIVQGESKPRVKSAVAHRIAASIGRDPETRLAQLRSRVHGH